MVRGYARVSTQSQIAGTSMEDQRKALTTAGCEVIYEDEACSGTSLDRPEFQRLCDDAVSGDTLVFTKLDRIARSETKAYDLVLDWVKRGIRVNILNLGTIEDTVTGRLILHIMLAFAEFERDTIVERMQRGREYRRSNDPTYREGRPRVYTQQQLDVAMDMLRDHSYTEVANTMRISKATLTREAKKRGFHKDSPFKT